MVIQTWVIGRHFLKKWPKRACHFKENNSVFMVNDKIQVLGEN